MSWRTMDLSEYISIHALREEGDNHLRRPDGRPEISIHALREEGDPPGLLAGAHPVRFQSTPSARRATVSFYRYVSQHGFQSTPSARRATFHPVCRAKSCNISIHALREEGDDVLPLRLRAETLFQSTPSARRATIVKASQCADLPDISIHALREESDLQTMHRAAPAHRFQSTPSARRATDPL